LNQGKTYEGQVEQGKRLALARNFLANTQNVYLIETLAFYIGNCGDGGDEHEEVTELNAVLDYIIEDGCDVSGYGLWEIPTAGVYIFFDSANRAEFVVFARKNTAVTAGFISDDEVYTQNIRAAIEGSAQWLDG